MTSESPAVSTPKLTAEDARRALLELARKRDAEYRAQTATARAGVAYNKIIDALGRDELRVLTQRYGIKDTHSKSVAVLRSLLGVEE